MTAIFIVQSFLSAFGELLQGIVSPRVAEFWLGKVEVPEAMVLIDMDGSMEAAVREDVDVPCIVGGSPGFRSFEGGSPCSRRGKARIAPSSQTPSPSFLAMQAVRAWPCSSRAKKIIPPCAGPWSILSNSAWS